MNKLEIVYDKASELPTLNPTQFAMIRRQGFGASDASILLGVNPYETKEKLIQQKASPFVTDDELKIGSLPAVRAGHDLEPVILSKFETRFEVQVAKPEPMYRIAGTHLTLNFDGIMEYHGYDIPVECKYISQYGGKYYDFTKAIDSLAVVPPRIIAHKDDTIEEHIRKAALKCGIPGYYYTQLQQQILGADAPWGYLTCLDSKTWTYYTFIVPKDDHTIATLMAQSKLAWDEVEQLRKRG